VNHTGAEFLKYGVGGRASAMGEAFSAVYGDITSAYWNPAGISLIEKSQLAAMHSEAIFSTSIEYFGAAAGAGKGALGLYAVFSINDPVPFADESGDVEGEIKWSDWSVAGVYARPVAESLSVGAALKVIVRREEDPYFGETSCRALAGDLGFIYSLPIEETINFGVSVVNIGDGIRLKEEKRTDDLPATVRIGGSWKKQPMNFSFETNKIIKEDWNFGAGAELEYTENIFLRTGYYTKSGYIKGLTYGLGVKYASLCFDWANLPAGEMVGAARENRFSLILSF